MKKIKGISKDAYFKYNTCTGEILECLPEVQKAIYNAYPETFGITIDQLDTYGLSETEGLDAEELPPELPATFSRNIAEDMSTIGAFQNDGPEMVLFEPLRGMDTGKDMAELMEAMGWKIETVGDGTAYLIVE